MVQAPTIEGTLPLHIAAAEGHGEVASLILHYDYPPDVTKIFRIKEGDQLYRLGLPVNAKDSRGHSPLHMSCMYNHYHIASMLLNFTVCPFKRDFLFSPSKDSANVGYAARRPRDLESPEVREATENLFTEQLAMHNASELHPVEIDSLDLDGLSALHLAIIGNDTGSYHQVAELLLHHGANPNKPLISTSGNTTALMEACQHGDVKMMDLLLRHKALDTEQKVLSAAVLSQDDDMISTILKYQVFQDSDYKINRSALDVVGRQDAATSETEQEPDNPPQCPVAINWYHMGVSNVSLTWLREACLMHNPLTSPSLLLHTITRIDVSKNNIHSLPDEIFQLKSLRLLNASHNRLKWLPGSSDVAMTPMEESNKLCLAYPMKDSDGDKQSGAPWDCPWLEDIELSNNKLKYVPPDLFMLPNLQKLNLCGNELDRLPFHIWLAPVLSELNLSHNKLKVLPTCPDSSLSLSLGGASEDNSLKGSNETLNSEDASNSSMPGTPHRSHPSTQDSDRGSTPTAASIDTPTSEEDDAAHRAYKEVGVEHHSYWQDRVHVHATTVDIDIHSGRDKRGKLHELNVSHNVFDLVPAALACLAPQLSKLNLSHNRLTQIGSLSVFPVALKWLDLSHNLILGHVLFDTPRTDDDGPFSDRWAAGKYCYSPHRISHKNTKRSVFIQVQGH